MSSIILKNSDHCQLCDNLKFNLKDGTFCELTNQRPEFKNSCVKIDLNHTYKEKIELINLEHQSICNTKRSINQSIIFYIVIAISIFALGYILTSYLWDIGYVSTISILAIFVGLVPLGKAISLFNHYKTNKKIATNKKGVLDKITSLYGYKYDVNIDAFHDSLGNIEYNTNLKIQKK